MRVFGWCSDGHRSPRCPPGRLFVVHQLEVVHPHLAVAAADVVIAVARGGAYQYDMGRDPVRCVVGELDRELLPFGYRFVEDQLPVGDHRRALRVEEGVFVARVDADRHLGRSRW